MIITADDSQLEATMHSAVASVAAASAEMDAVSAAASDKTNSNFGAVKWGGWLGAGVGLAALITPITTIAFSAAAAAVSLASVGSALIGVGIGAAYFSQQVFSANEGLGALGHAVQAVELQLTGLGLSISKSLGSGGEAATGIKSLQADVMILVQQSAPFITEFIKNLTSAGGGLAQAFLAPGAGGQSIFQEWATAISNLVNGGGGLTAFFVSLQGPALALVRGITELIASFHNLATLSGGIIGLTTQIITQFFHVLSGLVPGYSRLSIAADGVLLALLKVANAALPAINAGLAIFATALHLAANAVVFFLSGITGILHALGPIGSAVGGAVVSLGLLFSMLHKFTGLSFAGFIGGLTGLLGFVRAFASLSVEFGFLATLQVAFPVIAGAIETAGTALAGLIDTAAGITGLVVDATSLAAAFTAIAGPIGLAVAAYNFLGASTVPVQSNLEHIDSLLNMVSKNEAPIQWARNYAISLGATGAAFDAAAKSGQTYEATVRQLGQAAAAASWLNAQKQMLSASHQVQAEIAKTTQLTSHEQTALSQFATATGSSFTAMVTQVRTAVQGLTAGSFMSMKDFATKFIAPMTQAFAQLKTGIASAFSSITISATEGVGQFKRAMDQMLSIDRKWAADQKQILDKVGASAKPFLLFLAQQGPAAFKVLDGAASENKKKLSSLVGEYNRTQSAGNKLAQGIVHTLVGALNNVIKAFVQMAQHMHLISSSAAAALIAALTHTGAAADGAKGKADDLTASLLNIPTSVTSQIIVDAAAAISAIGTVMGLLNSVNGFVAHAVISVSKQVTTAAKGMGPATGAILGSALHLASGGITQMPTTLVGEGSYPTFAGRGAEAVIPLDSRGLGILAQALKLAFAQSGGNGGGEVIHVHGNVYGWDDFRRQVKKAQDQNLAAKRSIR